MNEENPVWPSLIYPPTFGTYPSLAPWSFQRPYQQSLSGLLFPSQTMSQFQFGNTTATSTGLTWNVLPASGGLIYPYGFGGVPENAKVEQEQPPALPEGTRQQPVVGYRAWNVFWTHQELGRGQQLSLRSIAADYNWQADINVADCRVKHDAIPYEYCGCGFWVMSTLHKLSMNVGVVADSMVVGAVMGWGRVIQHGDAGWRAQYARPIALLDLKMGKKNRKLTKLISKMYNLPIYERDALELIVGEHDGQLPTDAQGEEAQ